MRIIPREITDAAERIGTLVEKINAAGGGDNAAALLVDLRGEVAGFKTLTAQFADIASHIDAIVEAAPEQIKAFVAAILNALVALGSKGEATLGQWGTLAAKLIQIAVLIRQGQWAEVRELRFGDGVPIEVKVRLTPDGEAG